MTILDEGAILQALNNATKAAIIASTVNTWVDENRIKFAGRSFTPPDDQKYVEVVFIPGEGRAYYGDSQHYEGMFRLVLHWPNNDEGAYEPLAVLKSIGAWFSNGKRFDGVVITRPPRSMGILEQERETLYPASLRFNAFRI